MTRLWNDPEAFAAELCAGFVRAHAPWVREVAGGVARSTRSDAAEVALVIGGGSGHYPAFAGLVGPGLAHGAAMGNIFASPSAAQVESVIRASEQGRGVLLSYGNYAGDVMHFTAAQDAVLADGIDCRTVVVTDDISSAPPGRVDERRGIAGDLVVFKVAGAAAAEGAGLEEVERVARRANERTRSLGVAFGGCTLPGASQPLFDVPDGRMAVGLGIHGEPGIDEIDVPTADGLAELFVRHLLDPAEIPDGVQVRGTQVVPVLNGLGAVKAEELFVVYRRVADLLQEAGATVLTPHVGEYCTSFDMAGASLTLFWVDEELRRLWVAPADTPAYRTGSVGSADRHVQVETTQHRSATDVVVSASEVSRVGGARAARALDAARGAIEDRVEDLGRLDAIAGDGDHGLGMQRGVRAASEAARAAVDGGAGAGTVLVRAGEAWADRAGGASGALWGTMLRAIGERLGDQDEVTATAVSEGVTAAADEVMRLGRAQVGDRTLVDALVPFARTLAEQVAAGDRTVLAWAGAARAARVAADQTSELLPMVGRARSHGHRALGTPDPGAVSFAHVVEAVHDALAEEV